VSCYLISITIFAKSGSKPRITSNSQRAGAEPGLSNTQKPKKSVITDADRQKKIREVEHQLAKATLSSETAERQRQFREAEEQLVKAVVTTSSSSQKPARLQTNRTISLKMMNDSARKMVAPGSKDAPRFKSSNPEGLRRFIRLMEDLWDAAGVTDDETKKQTIGKYADQDSEEEWSAFKTYDVGHSWMEFKDELIENYPEAAAAERGTPARIKQICAETSKIRLGDMPALYSFRRAFLAEAKKLLKEPAAMANRELVELFVGCLSDTLASAVFQFLGSSTMSKVDDAGKAKEGEAPKKSESRRPEDKYDLEDVCKAAIQVSENSQGMFNLMKKESSSTTGGRDVFLFNQPVSEAKALSEKVEELEGVQALERDRLVSMNKTIESRFGGLEDLIKTLLTQHQAGTSQGQCKGDCKNGSCKTHESSTGPTQKWGTRSMENEKCFYCGLLGHFQADCEDLKNQIKAGNIKVNPEGKLRLRDGSFIPNQPMGATLKERVERHYARKPSHFYHGEYEEDDPVPSLSPGYSSQYLGTSNDAEKRIAQLKAELDLRKREDALELRKKLVEQEEKKLEQANGSSRATNVLDLLGQLSDEEIAAIKAARSGFC
jgi:hypothetical protein